MKKSKKQMTLSVRDRLLNVGPLGIIAAALVLTISFVAIESIDLPASIRGNPTYGRLEPITTSTSSLHAAPSKNSKAAQRRIQRLQKRAMRKAQTSSSTSSR